MRSAARVCHLLRPVAPDSRVIPVETRLAGAWILAAFPVTEVSWDDLRRVLFDDGRSGGRNRVGSGGGVDAPEVRQRRELPFALLPATFALHQFLEVFVWAGLDGDVPAGLAEWAMRAHLFIAWPLLPTYVPLAVMLLEPKSARLRVAPFLALGVVVSAYLA